MSYQLFTKDGIDSFIVISAVQKFCRRNQPNEAIKRAGLLLPDEGYSGYDTRLWSRLLIICCEDLADSDIFMKVNALKDAYFWIKKKNTGPFKEGRLMVVRAIEVISSGKKSRSTTYRTISQLERPDPIDLENEKKVNPFIRDIHTKEGKKNWSEKGLTVIDRCDQEDSALVPLQETTREDQELRAKALNKLRKKDDVHLFDVDE